MRVEVWKDEFGNVVQYNLTYINHAIYSKDNGRVLGYDNAHGAHHRHYKGKVEAISYKGLGQIKARFNRDLANLLGGAKK